MSPFWVKTDNDLRLAIVPRPRGGDWLDDEIAHLKREGVDVLISMLPSSEADELGLATEPQACEVAGIIFKSFRIIDRETPASTSAFTDFIKSLRHDLRDGRSIAVHCRSSIGRSSLLLASLLCAEGFKPDDAFSRLTKARGLQVPDTQEQIRWVERFAQTINEQLTTNN